MEDWPRCTFRDALARSAAAWPEAEAIVTPEGRITYAALAADVDRVAANLHRLGLRRGDHMALCMGNSVRWAVILFAAASLGAVTVPVNTRWRPPEIEYALRQSEAAMLVTADRLLKMDFIAALRGILPEIDATLPAARLPKLRCVIVDGDDVPAAVIPGTELDRAAVFHPVTFDPGDVALIQYTSGTTSAPKGAMLTHDSMLRDAFHVGRRLGLRPGDRYLSQRPLFHVAGVTLSLLTAILAGATYVTTPTFDAAEAVRLMREEGITHLSGNDTMFLMILAVPPTPDERIALRGGWAAASETVLRQAQARFGMPGLCVAYGQSEASPNVAMGPWDDDLEKRLSGHAFPLPGLDVRIRDESGADLPPGSLGQITVRGWCVMRGYWNMPEQTAQTIDADGWLRPPGRGAGPGGGRARPAAAGGARRLRHPARWRGLLARRPHRVVQGPPRRLPRAAPPPRGGKLRRHRHDGEFQGAEGQAARACHPRPRPGVIRHAPPCRRSGSRRLPAPAR